MDKYVADDFLILEDYVETKLGKCYLITLTDYKKFNEYSTVLGLQKFQLIRLLNTEANKLEDYTQKDSLLNFIKEIKDLNFIDIINSGIFGINDLYKNMFELCFKSDVFDLIKTDEELSYYIDLIITINNVNIVKENPNPEIEWFNKLERMRSKDDTVVAFKHIYTSIWAYTGQRPPKDMTLYAFFNLFSQIAQFKNHDATVLYRTVSNEIDLVNWCGELSQQQKEIKQSDFENRSKNLLGGK